MSTADTKEEDDKADVNSPTGSATNTMLIPEKGDVKMAGYLEKRGKMKLISTWKRYWFVLEGRLLLYYRSQLEYLNLSACRGSLNMGIASCVRPVSGPGFVMEVVTRTHVITLRTKDRAVQEQWLQALLDSMALPNISSPMRNNGGPLHFRYSMDNLPTTDEMEQHDKEIRDKQGTLPRQPRPPSRQECVLNRIKHLGGHSYGASLDAILNRQSTNQIQQPKIPRIKAVDRMLELQARDIEQDPSYTEGSENNVTPPNKKENEIKSDKPKTMPELGSDEQNSPQIAVGQGESPLREKLEGSHSNEIQITEMKVQASSMKEVAEKTSSDYVQSVPSSSLTETSNMNMNYESALEVGRSNDVTEDIVKDKDTEQSSNITPQYVEVENQLYIESSQESAGGKSCESTDGVTRKTKSVADTISKGIEISADEDDEYYSNYDKALVMQNDENTISEPILPPRPSVSSPDSHDEVEYVEYNKYYEPEIQSEPLSPCTEEEKKKKKLRLRREKSLKDLITSENRSNHKNRKMSFLRKMLKHYRKKAEHTQEGDDEPEYDTVDYSSVCPGSKDERSTDCRQEEELSQRKSIGTAALLTKCALEELQLKLKEREHGSTKQVTDDKVFDEMEKITSSNSLAEERSSMKDCKDLDSRNDVLPSDIEERPQLPPRRTRRPSSPWHDIPTNNSPVYGNFNFHSISSSENKCNEDNSVWSQEMQDELLGTPQGYSYLQNKWKAAEGSVEWHRELRQVAFPVNTRNQGPKLLNTNDSEHVVHHDHSDGNVFKTECSFRNNEEDSVRVDSAEIYSKIDKKLGEITNNSTQEKNEVGSKEFCEQGVKDVKQTEQKSSEVCVVENMNYIPCCNLNSNNITLLTLQVETSQDEHFQKDSLMTSLCTQAESELDDSIISINPSVSKRTNSELDHENIIVLSKDQNYLGMKDGKVHSECECDNKITSDEIPFIKKMETESNPDNVLREGTKEVTNRYSDELNRLLAQLAEITSAPLLSPGATKSLIDFPESKTSHFHDFSFSDQITLLGPIRRRRHSEPDYDIPRPHNSLIQIKSFPTAPMHLPYASIYQDKNLIETTPFLEPSLPEEPSETSSVMKDTDQTQLSWTLSMAPDSLEPIPVKYLETINKPTS